MAGGGGGAVLETGIVRLFTIGIFAHVWRRVASIARGFVIPNVSSARMALHLPLELG